MKKLLILQAVTLIVSGVWSLIPVKNSEAQKVEQIKNPVLVDAKNLIKQGKEVVSTTDSMLNKVAAIAQTVKEIQDNIPKDQTKEKEVKKIPYPVYIEKKKKESESEWVVEKQYINRPIIIQTACKTYGGGEIPYDNYNEWLKKNPKGKSKDYSKYIKELFNNKNQIK